MSDAGRTCERAHRQHLNQFAPIRGTDARLIVQFAGGGFHFYGLPNQPQSTLHVARAHDRKAQLTLQ